MSIRRWSSVLLVLVSAAFTTGCIKLLPQGMRGSLGGSSKGKESKWSRKRPARYAGAACDQVLYDLSEIKGHNHNPPRIKDASLERQVLLAVCRRGYKVGRYRHTIEQRPRYQRLDPVRDVHQKLSVRRLDAVSMALSAFWTAFPLHSYRRDSEAKVGMMRAYLELADEATLEAQLATVKLPQEAKTTFLQLVEAARIKLDGEVAKLAPEERQLLVDIPVQVAKARRAYFRKVAPLYAELDALRQETSAARKGGAVTGAHAKKLEALRAKYIKACGKLVCAKQPFYADVTRELALVHVARGDALAAKAESRPFARSGSYLARFAAAVRVAQQAAGLKMRAAYERYQAARKRGIDEATARNMAGGGPIFKYSGYGLLKAKTSMPDFGAALAQKRRAYGFSGVVRSLRRSGGMTTVLFKKNRIKHRIAYACRRTRRVVRIHRDGRLQYEENCRYRTKVEIKDSRPPVKLFPAEARYLRAGDMVIGVERSGTGRVLRVERREKVIQLRGDLLRIPAPVQKKKRRRWGRRA